MKRFVVAALLGVLFLSSAQAEAAQRKLTRKEIRAMSIYDRPDRPGHFYGNTVRRVHRWRCN